MDADECNGRFYVSCSGDSSMERGFTGGLGGPCVSTPNSQHTSPSQCLSANSIKVEPYSDEQPGRRVGPEERGGDERAKGWKNERGDHKAEEENPDLGGGGEGEGGGYRELDCPEPVSLGAIRLPNRKLKCDVCGMICIGPNVLMVHKRSHTGERPFQCNQCGASFTQKGNLLRHIKLHSGEKPFKCSFCNYACRRRDALTGHLRTHSVSSHTGGKPYKCSYCGRSYKQQNTLEEHRECCNSYLQSLDTQPPHSTHAQGEDLRDLDFMQDSFLQPSQKMTFIDRLANSITKRKRSTPQKFVGKKHMRLSLLDAPYELSSGYDKERDVIGLQHGGADPPNFVAVGGSCLGASGGGGGGGAPDAIRPLRPPTPHSTCLSELTPIISVYTQLAPLGPRMDCMGAAGGGGGGRVTLGWGRREAGDGHEDLPPGCSHTPSSSNGCQDSTDTESMVEEPCIPGGTPLPAPAPNAKEKDSERERVNGGPSLPPQPPASPPLQLQPQPLLPPLAPGPASPASRDALRVVDGDGRPVRSFRCEHCRVLFLDHVMFTIHMGCHGFRQPLECNFCGHRSQDRYEFSSHIVRGEHKVG